MRNRLKKADHVYCRYCRRNVDRVSAEYRSIFRWRTSTEYRSYVGGISVNCRWYVGQLSVAYRSTIGRISVVCHMYRQITGRYIGQVSVKYRPIIGEVSAKCRPSVCEVSVTWKLHRPTYISTDYRLTIDRLSTECRSTVDRVSIDSRSSVDRYVDRYSGRHSGRQYLQ